MHLKLASVKENADGSPVLLCLSDLSWKEPKQQTQLTFSAKRYLSAINGRDGKVLWTKPLGATEKLDTLIQDRLPLGLSESFQDIDGDGTTDLVMTVPEYEDIEGNIQVGCELWGVSGRDGTTLWEYPLLRFAYHGAEAENSQTI